jgi:hypothetical protein
MDLRGALSLAMLPFALLFPLIWFAKTNTPRVTRSLDFGSLGW